MASNTGQPTRNCVSCGRSISWDANVCQYCGHDYRMLMAGLLAAPRKESSKPIIGGVLILIGALLLTVGAGICLLVLFPLAILAFIGGVFALMRKNYALAVVGGVLSIPSIVGLVGLILVILSKDEFQ